MQHIIIGAGPAGVVAAETLRKTDPEAEITLIGDEPEPPYSRMAIPYYLCDNIDESGFSKMIRELIFSKYLDVYHIERYRHRLSIDGEPLYYFAIAGRKKADVPDDFLDSKGILA